jgi:hypothetical protein
MDVKGRTLVVVARGDRLRVAVRDLLPANSPRHRGLVDPAHVEVLAGIEAELPPILVHRETMRVVDGMHRLHAAKLRFAPDIGVTFFDGTEADAFVEAVRTNIAHGKPLKLAERRAAAAQILSTHSNWSDRAIAEVCGLSAKTVASIRSSASDEVPRLHSRVGRDGRARPLDNRTGRQRAADYINAHPEASLRRIAAATDVCANTARDVRNKLGRGAEPSPRSIADGRDPEGGGDDERDLSAVVADAAITSSAPGRKLLDLLARHDLDHEEWTDLVESIPLSRVYLVSDLARSCAEAWAGFARALDDRARRS